MTTLLAEALRQISLCSQNSASSKEECGRIARAALAAHDAAPQVPLFGKLIAEHPGLQAELKEAWAQPQEREQFEALVDDLLAASANDETESARQKAHEWFENRRPAQPQTAAIAQLGDVVCHVSTCGVPWCKEHGICQAALKAAQPQEPPPLTAGQIETILMHIDGPVRREWFTRFARAIEAAHGIKPAR